MLSPLNVIGMLALVGLVITVVLRLVGVGWGKSLTAGFVIVPVGLLIAGGMGYAGLVAIQQGDEPRARASLERIRAIGDRRIATWLEDRIAEAATER